MSVDPMIEPALLAVSVEDSGTRLRWFDTVCRTYDECGDPPEWDRFKQALAETDAPADAVRSFVDHLDGESSRMDVLERMRLAGAELPTQYDEVVAAKAKKWNDFLAANGVRWNGDDAAWDQFATWFEYQAGQAGVGTQAASFIALADSDGRIATFQRYGVAVVAPAAVAQQESSAEVQVSDYPVVKAGDTGPWVAHLDAMLSRAGY